MSNVIPLIDYMHRDRDMSEVGEPMEFARFIINTAFSRVFTISQPSMCLIHPAQVKQDFRGIGEKECEVCFVGYFHHS